MRDSGSTFRYGDCSNCTASACFRVPSNTASPVVLTKSARTIESLSVNFVLECDRQYNPALMSTTITAAAAAVAPNLLGKGKVIAAAEDSGRAGAAAREPEP